MNIIQVYKKFPTQESCIAHLEQVRWKGKLICPYCRSDKQTPLPKEHRYHCNKCNTSYSVTSGTLFYKTKIDLQKWFLAISIVLNAKHGVSIREMSKNIKVTKDTAWYMIMHIRRAFVEYSDLIKGIVADEIYIGSKNKNAIKNKKTKDGQRRNGKNKMPVIGVLQRDSKIKTKKSKETASGKISRSFIKTKTVVSL